MTAPDLRSPSEHRSDASAHCVRVADAHPDATPDELRAALVAMMRDHGIVSSSGDPHEWARARIWSMQADIVIRERRRQRGESVCQYVHCCANEAEPRNAGFGWVGLCAEHCESYIRKWKRPWP